MKEGAAARLGCIDGVRGLLMAFMALDHAVWFLARYSPPDELWGGPFPAYADWASFASRAVSHLCAPGFFFLMGVSMFLFASSRRAQGWSEREIRRFFVVRGLLFVAAQFVLENPLWALSVKSTLGDMMGYVGVLFALGAAMVLAAGALTLSARNVLLLGAGCIALSQLLLPPEGRFDEGYGVLARLWLVVGRTGVVWVYFPILPWLGVALLGVAFGRRIARDGDAAIAWLGRVGACSVLAFLALRFLSPLGNLRAPVADGGWLARLALVKYPPSFLFLAVTLGIDSVLLAAWRHFGLGARALFRPFVTLGQAPFFFYLAHLALFGIVALWLRGPGIALAPVYGLWIAGILMLLPPARRYGEWKRRQSPLSFARLL